MKLLFAIVAISATLFACSKSSSDREHADPSYVGTYTSSNKDTIKVSTNGEYVKFVFRNYESVHTPVPPPTTPTSIGVREQQTIITFDSVRVVEDQSFTNNEICEMYTYSTGTISPLPPPSSTQSTVTGHGSFGSNTITTTFNIGGGTLNFSGIKTN